MRFIAFALALILAAGYLGFQNRITSDLEAATEEVLPPGNGMGVADPLSRGPVSIGGRPGTPAENPDDLRMVDLYGWKSYGPVVAAAGDTAYFLDQALAGFRWDRQKPDRPADFRMIGHNADCRLRPLGPGERLANVTIGHAERLSGLNAYSEAEMAQDTLRWVQQSLRRNRYLDDDDLVRNHAVPVTDVIVTETSAPVYLLLQHQARRVLWNVQVAPGVRIAHIALVGPDTAALNAPPGAYGVEAVKSGTGCVPAVARKPQPWWGVQTHAEVAEDRDGIVARMTERHAAYDRWFREIFDRSSEEGAIGFDLTNHVLVGPLPEAPEARASYRPIAGSTVIVTEQDYVFTAPRRDRVSFMMDLQRGLVAEVAGGDIAMLFPEPMERPAE